MSFFGFDQPDLESEKKKFADGDSEDLAVYTWGEESYDGLGDALQEGGDELNDETFGATGDVGKDFDFTNPALPAPAAPAHEPPRAAPSLEAIWDDKSPFSVLPRARASPAVSHSQYPSAEPLSHGVTQTGGRTLQEVELEMRAAVQRQQAQLQQQQHAQEAQLQAQQQRQLQYQQQQQRILQQQEQQEKLLLLQEQQARLQRQEQQAQLLRLQEQQLQQHQQRTPPPRMLPVSQSPRFHEHERQRQLLHLQQQHEVHQQQRLQELSEQLRVEEIERQLRAQQLSGASGFAHQRQLSAELHRRTPSRSPGFSDAHYAVPLQQSMPYLPQNIQMQQRLLSELAQAEFMREMGAPQAEQEALRSEAVRKILEAERMEERRRRRAAKIAHMARYNDLMTQSDKDFITRIQVSQLVTQDPYAEDFYAQVYGAILRSRLGLQAQDERVLKFGSGGGVGLGLAQKSGGRRPNAMQRMEAQVERIVSNARLREKEKGLHSLHSLQGALGKTSGRSYKAAPRQLLQVDAGNAGASPTLSHTNAHISKEDGVQGAAMEAAKLGREALGNAADTDGLVRKDPLSSRQVLVILENLYDVVLRVEQLRRDQPPPEEEEATEEWTAEYNDLVKQLWDGLRVMVPLQTSDPHPFISLLAPTKGKKLLPRLTRHLSNQQMLTLLTLLVACFSQLDVVRFAPLLDTAEDTRERQDVDRQTQAFLGSVLQSILPVVAKAGLRLVTGLLGLLLDRSDIVAVAQTRPGLALLTLFLSRVEVIKQTMSSTTELSELPTPEEAQQWQLMFDHLFQLLAPHFLRLFPSARAAGGAGQAAPPESVEQPVWQFLAALALHAVTEQHQTLVTALREKVLENVVAASKGWITDEDERQAKLANVNLFLHALGLDSSQIAL